MILKQTRAALLACLAMLLAAVPAFAQPPQSIQIDQAKIVPLGITQLPAVTFEQPSVAITTDPHVAHGWDAQTSHTECGGLRRDGQPQLPCEPARATYIGPAKGQCDAGYNFDIVTWSCNRCPAGFDQTLAGVNTDRACSRKAASPTGPEFLPATFLGPLCPNADATHEKGFYDSIRGGECWACPKGYNTNVLPRVDAPDKCTRPERQDFKYAIKHDRPTSKTGLPPKLDCPSGQMWDGWDGGWCWSCPAGYDNVVLNPIYSDHKCMRVDRADNRPAVVLGTGQCEAGAMTDTRNGGECWKCPAGYDNVILEPVTSSRKCQTTPALEFSKMESQVALTCPAGQVFDFIAVDAGRLAELKRVGAAAANASISGSGTCWQCPPDTKRTVAAVYEPNSCQGDIYIQWYSAPTKPTGLFKLDGGGDVVVEMLRDDYARVDEAIRELVKACAASSGDSCAGDEANQAAELWAEIRNTPGASALLQNMALGRIELAASGTTPADTRPATAADKRLAASFAGYVQAKRMYVANESLAAYDAWEKAKAYWGDWARQAELRDQQNQQGKNGAAIAIPTGIGDLFPPPPDWHSVIQDAMMGSVGGAALLTGGVMVATSKSAALRRLIRPNAKIRANIIKRTGDIAKKTTTKVTTKITTSTVEKTAGETTAKGIGKALSKIAPKVLKFLKFAGPAAVVAVVVEVVVDIAMTADENSKTDRNHLLAMRAAASQPVDLKRMFATDVGTTELEGYWTLAMSGLNDPDAATAAKIAALVDAKGAGAATGTAAGGTWTALPGAAVDIGAGGALWVVGDDHVPGGHTVWRWAGNNWQKVAGGGVRIDVDAQGNAWLVNDAGAVFRWNGSAWATLPGKVSDIGVGANGSAWAIGVEAAPGGRKVFRWTGSDWQAVDGGAVRVDVDPQGNAWLVNDAGTVFHWTGNDWATAAGIKAIDVGAGADGSVFALDSAGGVNKWNGSAWTKRDGTLQAISVDPRGVPYGVNAQHTIFMGYR
jgi:hypothetical protein